MRVNNFNQNFGAKLVVNDSLKKAVENAKDASRVGCLNQTVQFINAVQAIKHTDEFDTFEIIAQTEEEGAKARYSTSHPYEIKIDGKVYKCQMEDPTAISLFGGHQASCATAGIIRFAKEFFGSDFNHPITNKHKELNKMRANILEQKRRIQVMEQNAFYLSNAVASDYERTLNKLI